MNQMNRSKYAPALCAENFCTIVIVPHNLTKKFQPLDITVNKPAKSFIAQRYNAWFSDQVASQLANGKSATDVKVSLKLTEIKPLYAQLIVDVHHYLRKGILFSMVLLLLVFLKAVESAQSVRERIENPF